LSALTVALLFLAGILAGTCGGLLGIGGGAVMLPIVRFGFDFEPAVAVGTTLVAVVFTAVSGTYQHWKLGHVDWKSVKYIAPAGIIGVILGSVLFFSIKDYSEVIDLILGVIFIPIAVTMVFEGVFRKGKPEFLGNRMGGSIAVKAGLGSSVGFLTGISGLGGGFILVPSFIYILRSPVRVAIGTSMASFLWFAVVGGVFKIAEGLCDIPAAVAMGLGAAGGAVIGAKLITHIKPSIVKLVFGLIFLYISAKYILNYFGVTI
jgi:uncharacterized membrane protein YfcA